MSLGVLLHDPDAVLDYGVNWADWLDGDTLSSVVWTVPSGFTLESQTQTDTVATVWLSGGTAGTRVTVTCHVVTAAGREDDRSFDLVVQER